MGDDEGEVLGPVGGDDEGLGVGVPGGRVSPSGGGEPTRSDFEAGDCDAYCDYGSLSEAGDSDGDSSSRSKVFLGASDRASKALRNQLRAEEPGGCTIEEGPNNIPVVGFQDQVPQFLLLQSGLARIEEGLARMGERLASVERNVVILLQNHDVTRAIPA